MENLRFEFNKISSAFERVKEDVVSLKREVSQVKSENKSLKEKLINVSNRKPKVRTKIKTVTKTIVRIVKTGISKHKIVGNPKTKKIHYSTCTHARKLNKKNSVQFKTVRDALKKGYNRCHCIFHN